MKYFKKFASAADAEEFFHEVDLRLYIYITNATTTSTNEFERTGNQVYYIGVGLKPAR